MAITQSLNFEIHSEKSPRWRYDKEAFRAPTKDEAEKLKSYGKVIYLRLAKYEVIYCCNMGDVRSSGNPYSDHNFELVREYEFYTHASPKQGYMDAKRHKEVLWKDRLIVHPHSGGLVTEKQLALHAIALQEIRGEYANKVLDEFVFERYLETSKRTGKNAALLEYFSERVKNIDSWRVYSKVRAGKAYRTRIGDKEEAVYILEKKDTSPVAGLTEHGEFTSISHDHFLSTDSQSPIVVEDFNFDAALAPLLTDPDVAKRKRASEAVKAREKIKEKVQKRIDRYKSQSEKLLKRAEEARQALEKMV